MTEINNKLKSLFSLSEQPVLGVEKGLVVFANPVMFSAIEKDPTGMKISDLLPEHVTAEESDSFVSSGTLKGIPAIIAVTKFQDTTVYFFTLKSRELQPAYIAPPPLVASMRSYVFSVRLAIDQLTEMLGAGDNKKVDAYISSLYRGYFSILRMTVNIDTFNHLADGTLEFSPRICEVVSFISDLISSLSHFLSEKDATLEFVCQEPRILCVLDPVRLEQLLLNLLSNSVQHTKKDGKITVTLHDDENNVIISIDDTGDGVPTEALGSIFSRHNRRYALADMTDGLGLGLSIARGIAELHSGALLIESRHGKGTSVRVMLPKNLDKSSGVREPAEPVRDASAILREFSGIICSRFYSKYYLD